MIDAAAYIEAGGFPGPVGTPGFGGGGDGTRGGVADAIGQANTQMSGQAADMAEAAASIADAVAEASETSQEAVGTGDPDNEGLSGDPASDMP